jgi:hypothetical protein
MEAPSKMLTATVDKGFLLGFFVGTRLFEVVNISPVVCGRYFGILWG